MTSINSLFQHAAPGPAGLERRRRPGACRISSVVVLVALLLAGGGPPTSADGTDDVTAPSANPQMLLLDVARQALLPAPQRREAIKSLVDQGDPVVIKKLAQALTPGEDILFQRLIGQALVGRAAPPPISLAEPMLDLLVAADESLVPDLAAALARYRQPAVTQRLMAVAQDERAAERTRCAAITALAFRRDQQTVELLVNLLGPNEPDPVAHCAAEALKVLTGIGEFDRDPAGWRQWWSRHKALAPERWYALLADSLARRIELLNRQDEQASSRLLSVYRQLHRATDQDDRQSLLVTLLADDSSSIRQLAIDLMWQRLSDQQPFGPELRKALLPALSDPSASIRRGAARLLRDLSDQRGADAMARRLVGADEHDPDVLRVYLLVMADQPRARAIVAAMGLLADPALRNEAAGVLVRAVEEDVFGQSQRADLKLRLRRQINTNTPPVPKVIELLGYVGDQDDWQRIEQWIDSDQGKVKEAAAIAWARSARPLTVLAHRADDLLIQPIVIAAATRRGQRADTLMALLAHRPEQDQARQAWQRALVAMAGRVPPDDVLKAQAALGDEAQADDLRTQLLSEAIGKALPGSGNGNGGNGDDPAPPLPPQAEPTVIVDLLLERAQIRLAGGEPRMAMADLSVIVARNWTVEPAQRRRHDALSMKARLSAGDTPGAADVAAKALERERKLGDDAFSNAVNEVAAVFLDAASRHVTANQAKRAADVLAKLAELVGESLPDPLKQKVRQLDAQIQEPASPEPEDTTAPEPPEPPEPPETPEPKGSPQLPGATTPSPPGTPEKE